jgi:hypothetical protein
VHEDTCVISGSSTLDQQGTTLINFTKQMTAFDARKVLMRNFPRNLAIFLPKLYKIFIEGGLQSIQKEDLEKYTELVELFLSYNDIRVLEKDLFIHNTKLKRLYLNGNRIINVHPNVFDNLKSLFYLGFLNNICQSGNHQGSRTGVMKLVDSINSKCSNNATNVKEYLDNMQEESRVYFEELMRKESVKNIVTIGSSDHGIYLWIILMILLIVAFLILCLICCKYSDVD